MIARSLYRISTVLAAPFIARYMKQRLAEGKEDPHRFCERQGNATLPRPKGPLIWIHAASNGEAMSALPLIDLLLERDPNGHVLLTTGTVTSAHLMADKLPARAMHQFVPVDRSAWVASFLSHWKPDAGIWVESEFWPALIWEMRAAGKPVALVNGRVSKRSLARWRRIPGIAADLLAGFSPCLAQSPADADHLKDLGAYQAECVGNLKLSVAALPADADALSAEQAVLNSRPVWLAASTHPGEEDIVAEAHEKLRETVPSVVTILVPRHPKRGSEITERLTRRALKWPSAAWIKRYRAKPIFWLPIRWANWACFSDWRGLPLSGAACRAIMGVTIPSRPPGWAVRPYTGQTWLILARLPQIWMPQGAPSP
jgi:3-deoxy-D-manno-octulosonic-acid transferase